MKNKKIYIYEKDIKPLYSSDWINRKKISKKAKGVDYLYIQDEILPAEYIVFDGKITKEKNEAI